MGIHGALVHLKGTTTFFNGEYDAKSVTITICCALAIYNALELLLLIFTSFRKYRGLYFWSLLVASAGIIPYTIGFMVEYFQLTAQLVGEILPFFGWPMMVTGQSLVLYSRLGLVLGPTHQNILRATKWMIIIDGIVFHLTTEVVMFGAYNANDYHPYAQAYKVFEKVQMTVFTTQEFILSGLYIWGTFNILKTSEWSHRGKRIMRELLSINVLIIIMDIALLVVEYQDRHVIEQAVKQVVYSVKLKLEFAILSKLVSITHNKETDVTGIFDTVEDGSHDKTHLNQVTTPGLPRSDSVLSQSVSKGDALHVERTSSWLSGATQTSLPCATIDEKRRRRTLDEDPYASACRDIDG